MIQESGLSPTDRFVIINADDFGLTRSTNQAIAQMFQSHAITSASLMVPADCAQEAALQCSKFRSMNVGIHIDQSQKSLL